MACALPEGLQSAYGGVVTTDQSRPGATAYAGLPSRPAVLSAPAPPGLGAWSVLARTWLWGWLAIVQLVLDLLLVAPFVTVGSIVLSGVVSIPALLVGVPLTAVGLLAASLLARFERARLRAFTGVVVAAPGPPPARQSRWLTWLLDPRPWRATLHLTLIALWGVIAGTLATVLTSLAFALSALPLYRSQLPDGRLSLPWGASVPANPGLVLVGVFGLLVLPMVARGTVSVDVALTRWLLGGSTHAEVERLSARVETLTQTRVATLDSVELERRRIERDLHDGPQQRLVAIAMDLGMARGKLVSDPGGAADLLDKAHTAAKEAIVEMRQVARGIHPPVLTDRGLDAALSALAARSPIPVRVSVDLPTRPSPTVEAIAYFCVSEALTNVAKHSGARTAQVTVTQEPGPVLMATVSDDGLGGADPGGGTGLIGLGQRVAAVDGSLDVDSPPGGGTRLTVRLPMSPDRPTDEPPDRSQS